MKILVTGCAGFIGSHIAEALLKMGHNIIGIDNLDPYYSVKSKRKNIEILRKFKNFRFIFGSILNDKILKKLKNEGVGMVNHQAAIAGVRSSIKEPIKYCENNVLGTVKLLDCFRDVKKFIYASSSSVYGEVPENELPMKETRNPDAISPYALSKLQGEKWCELFERIYGLKTILLRYFTVYGPRQRPDEAICKFIKNILKERAIKIYGDGNQTRDFTYVKDVVNANLLAMEKGRGIYNIASGGRVSVNELVRLITELTGKSPEIRHIGKQQGDVSHTLADITKAGKELGYRPSQTLKQGIKEHIQWFRESGRL